METNNTNDIKEARKPANPAGKIRRRCMDMTESEYKQFQNKMFPGGMFSVYDDEALTLYFVNEYMVSALGYETQNLLERYRGSSAQNLIQETDLPLFSETVKKVMGARRSEATKEGIVCRLRRRDGFWANCTLIGKRTLDHKGNFVVTFSATVDDENAKDAQASTVLDNLPMGVIFGIFRGRLPFVERANDRLCRILGYSLKELASIYGSCIKGIIHPDDEREYMSKMAVLSEFAQTMSLDFRVVTKGGDVVRVNQKISSVRNDRKQQMRFYSTMSVVDGDGDKDMLAKLGFLSQYSSCAIIIYENKDDILTTQYVNDSFCKHSGLSREECADLEPMEIFQNVCREDMCKINEAFSDIRNGAVEHHCDFRLDEDGRRRRIRLMVIAQREAEEIKRIGFMMFDVSDAAEELIEERLAAANPDDCSLREIRQAADGKPYFRTFGYFDVFVNGMPIPFKSAKAKELLALLVDRRGGFVSSAEIISSLWEDETVNGTTLARCRKTFMRLAAQLKEYGLDHILESHRTGGRRIVPEKISCDLFNYMNDKDLYGDTYTGAYMRNYSWSEYSMSELDSSRYIYEDA